MWIVEMLGPDLPGRIPVGPESVGFLRGHPLDLVVAGRRRRQLAAGEMGKPVGLHPAEGRMIDKTALELLDRVRPSPASFVRHITQQATGLAVVGLTSQHLVQADARQRVVSRLGFRGAPGEREQIGRRSAQDLIELGCPFVRLARRLGRDDVGQGYEPRRAVRRGRPGNPGTHIRGGERLPFSRQLLGQGGQFRGFSGQDRSPCALQLPAELFARVRARDLEREGQ